MSSDTAMITHAGCQDTTVTSVVADTLGSMATIPGACGKPATGGPYGSEPITRGYLVILDGMDIGSSAIGANRCVQGTNGPRVITRTVVTTLDTGRRPWCAAVILGCQATLTVVFGSSATGESAIAPATRGHQDTTYAAAGWRVPGTAEAGDAQCTAHIAPPTMPTITTATGMAIVTSIATCITDASLASATLASQSPRRDHGLKRIARIQDAQRPAVNNEGMPRHQLKPVIARRRGPQHPRVRAVTLELLNSRRPDASRQQVVAQPRATLKRHAVEGI